MWIYGTLNKISISISIAEFKRNDDTAFSYFRPPWTGTLYDSVCLSGLYYRQTDVFGAQYSSVTFLRHKWHATVERLLGVKGRKGSCINTWVWNIDDVTIGYENHLHAWDWEIFYQLNFIMNMRILNQTYVYTYTRTYIIHTRIHTYKPIYTHT